MSTRNEFEAATAALLAANLRVTPDAVSFRYSGPRDGHQDITALVRIGDRVRRVPLICGIGEE